MNLDLILKTFKEKFTAQCGFPSDIPVPVTLALKFTSGKVFANLSGSMVWESCLSSYDYADLNLAYDEKTVDFSTLEQNFKVNAPSLGFPYVKKREQEEAVFFLLGVETIMAPSDDLKTAEAVVQNIAQSLIKTFELLRLHKYIVLEKKIKAIVLYWDENLECVYLNYEHIPSAKFDLYDSDFTLRSTLGPQGTYWDEEVVPELEEKMEEEGGFFDYFEILQDEIISKVESQLSKVLSDNPIFDPGLKIYSCIHDVRELEDVLY